MCDVSVGNNISDDSDGNEEIAIDVQSDRNNSRGDDKNMQHRNKSKDVENVHFE